jgi:hypothetical protein
MELSTYKLIHYFGIMALFYGFGGLTLGALNAGGRNFAHRKLYSILHGVGLITVLVSGFGQLAKLNLGGMPNWVIAKLVIWLILGLSIAAILRKPKSNSYMWAVLLFWGTLAAYLGLYKPF